MRAVFGLVLMVGIALAGAAVYLAQNFMAQNSAAMEREEAFMASTGGMVPVYVVINPKNYGDTITKEDVQVVLWQNNALPEGVFSDEAVLFPPDMPEPRYVVRQMEKFEPILAVKVTEPGQQAGLNGQIEKGMRAFAISVEAAAFLQVGDHVDVYWTGLSPSSEGETTKLIETRLKIIATDNIKPEEAANASILSRTMTVSATPEQAGRLAQAQATGRLVMAMVGIDDDAVSGAVEVGARDLLGITQEAAPVIAAEAPAIAEVCTIRTRKGGELVEVVIPCTN